MKNLLAAASIAAAFAVGAVPAFAQSTTPSSAQPQNYRQAENYTQSPSYTPAPSYSNDPHIGSGFGSDYQTQQQQLQNMPGYSIGR
jgi:hypothetical protein